MALLGWTGIPPPLLSAAPHQYKTLGWQETTFLHLGRGIPQRQHRSPTPDGTGAGTSSDTGGSEEHPGQDPILMYSL